MGREFPNGTMVGPRLPPIPIEWNERKFHPDTISFFFATYRYRPIRMGENLYTIPFFRAELGNLMESQLHDLEIFDQISPHTNLYGVFLIFHV